MSARSYLSIGDVLTLLRQEFPDVTISKIRFLESQGLVNPERTPSGYRKFYEHDVERLRWVLRQQREHFLPLKVIKDRLDDGPPESGPPVSKASSKRPTPSNESPRHWSNADDGEHDEEPVLVGHRTSTEGKAASTGGRHSKESPLSLVGEGSTLPGIESSDHAAASADDPRGAVGPGAPVSSDSPPVSTGASPGPHRLSSDRPPVLGLVDDGSASGKRTTKSDPARVTGSTSRGTTPNGSASTGSTPADSASAGPASAGPAPTDSAPTGQSPPGPTSTDPTPRRPRTSSPTPDHPSASGSKGPVPAPTPAPVRSTASTARSAEGGSTSPPSGTGSGRARAQLTGVSMSAEELATSSGLDVTVVRELQEYGLLASSTVAGVENFDEEALVVATVAAQFTRFGIEPRHLRLYKNAADREAGFVEQVVLPLVRQRNPDARARAHETAEELAQLGQQLRGSLLRSALGGLLNG